VTAEHVWPQWIAKYLPDTKLPHLVVVEQEGQDSAVELRGDRPPFTTEVKCVCKPCNEGWMHELETTAKPILAPLIQGKPAIWHEWRQTIAATWAFKTAIMIEQAQSEMRAIPAEIYPLFRRYLTPPPFAQVWTGIYAGEYPHFYGRGPMRLVLTTPEGVAVPNDLAAYGACLQVGALVFRLFGHLIKDGPVNAPRGVIARCLVPIRPVVPRAEWPPELAVDDNGLELLVKSMGESSILGPEPPQDAK
jgi:hypothetical protein